MRTVLRCVALFWCCVLLSEAAPWRNLEAHQNQACGDKLADIMSLVCSGRGYNVAFRPERTSARRIRRGIVEECCRKSCSPAMLELYCRADPLEEEPSNVQIRKRSDSEVESVEVHKTSGVVAKPSIAEKETQNTITKKDSTAASSKEGEHNYKLLNLLIPSQQSSQKEDLSHSKSMQNNDTTEEDYFKPSNLPLMRHHRKHHRGFRQFSGRKGFSKTKRDKKAGAATPTFQIGTVKPYFAGKAFAAFRSNYVHQAPSSTSA